MSSQFSHFTVIVYLSIVWWQSQVVFFVVVVMEWARDNKENRMFFLYFSLPPLFSSWNLCLFVIFIDYFSRFFSFPHRQVVDRRLVSPTIDLMKTIFFFIDSDFFSKCNLELNEETEKAWKDYSRWNLLWSIDESNNNNNCVNFDPHDLLWSRKCSILSWARSQQTTNMLTELHNRSSSSTMSYDDESEFYNFRFSVFLSLAQQSKKILCGIMNIRIS